VHSRRGQGREQPREGPPVLGDRVLLPELADLVVLRGVEVASEQVDDGVVLSGVHAATIPSVELQGERILVRHLTAGDAPPLLAFMEENRAFLERWEPAREEDIFTLEAQLAEIEAAADD